MGDNFKALKGGMLEVLSDSSYTQVDFKVSLIKCYDAVKILQ